MSVELFERKEYKTWDEAFRGLAPVIRQQSVRVAEYTQVLYNQACISYFGADTLAGAARMKGEYVELAYKCGLYHQLGKALVPVEYQVLRDDFTEEEKALYCKYTTDGRRLVANLQERKKSIWAKKPEMTDKEIPTDNITWLMLREACEQHMERYDGMGYPNGLYKEEISVIGQIVGLAKMLDTLASEKVSEHPFDEAYVEILKQEGRAFSKELLEVLQACKGKCRSVYKKYVHYTKTLPETIPLVDKRDERPMGLSYRPMIFDATGETAAFEAIPWFGGVLGMPDNKESLKDVEDMMIRTEIMYDVMFYLMYEACDMILRLQNCKIKSKGVLLEMPRGFYEGETQIERFEKLFEDQPIDTSKLMLTVPEDLILNGDPKTKATLISYIEKGVCLVLDDYHPENLTVDALNRIGFTHVRLASELNVSLKASNDVAKLRNQGVNVIGNNADNHNTLSWMETNGFVFASGTLSGIPVSEDELIRDMIAKAQ